MTRDAFAELLRAACRRELGAPDPPVPDSEIRLQVTLGASNDEDALDNPRFTVYPHEFGPLPEGVGLDQFVELVWRDDRVPAWVDLVAIPPRGEGVWLRAICAGRFAEAEPELYNPGGDSLVFIGPFTYRSAGSRETPASAPPNE